MILNILGHGLYLDVRGELFIKNVIEETQNGVVASGFFKPESLTHLFILASLHVPSLQPLISVTYTHKPNNK